VPQSEVLVRTSVSQPLLSVPSQFSKPDAHVRPQTIAEQYDVLLGRDAQGRPQAPQFMRLARRSISQPFAAAPSQLSRPVSQAASAHTPLRHAPVPPENTQPLLHMPQCAALDERSVSQPLAALPSQSPKPALQRARAHAPAAQAATPLGKVHALPQRPQWATSVAKVTSHEAGLPSQSPKPAEQVVRVHTPIVQAAPAPGNEHTVAHVPQWLVSLRVFTSQPFIGSPSQSL
jgi:hypothetical protein